jgi:hypothetical protein
MMSWTESFRGKQSLQGFLCCRAKMVKYQQQVEFQCPKLEFGDNGCKGGLAHVAVQWLSNLY